MVEQDCRAAEQRQAVARGAASGRQIGGLVCCEPLAKKWVCTLAWISLFSLSPFYLASRGLVPEFRLGGVVHQPG